MARFITVGSEASPHFTRVGGASVMTDITIPQKRCTGVCKELKPATLDNFHKNASQKDGLSSVCKPCAIAFSAEYQKRPEVKERETVRSRLRRREQLDDYYIPLTYEQWDKMSDPSLTPTQRYEQSNKGRRQSRVRTLRVKYGMTIDEFHAIFKKQWKRCAICRKKFEGYDSIHVDHCHVTDKVRGLLCRNCNIMLGLVADQASVLKKAVAYLRKFDRTLGKRLPSPITQDRMDLIRLKLSRGEERREIARVLRVGRAAVDAIADGLVTSAVH